MELLGLLAGLAVAFLWLRYGRGPRDRRAMRARIREVGTPPAWKRRRDEP